MITRTAFSAFPLVGPADLDALDDAFDWELPADLHQRGVTFDEAYRHVEMIVGRVEKPKGSSHYQVRFEGERSWPLDFNFDRIPDRVIKELQPITGYPFEVIKYVLLFGAWPKRKLRLPIG